MVSLPIFVVLRFACGYCFSQKYYKWISSETRNASEFGKDLELKENIALYNTVTVQSISHVQQLIFAQIITILILYVKNEHNY